jgi:hypothetical protein
VGSFVYHGIRREHGLLLVSDGSQADVVPILGT